MGFELDAYGKPVYNQAPQTVLDLQAAADFANTFANVRAGTARADLTPGQLRDGLLYVETNNGDVYMRRAGGWKRILGDTDWTQLPFSNSWINFGGGAYGDVRYRRLNGVVYVSGVTKGGDIVPGRTMGTLPAGFRPSTYLMKGVPIQGGAGTVDITPAGLILAGTVSATYTSLELQFIQEQ